MRYLVCVLIGLGSLNVWSAQTVIATPFPPCQDPGPQVENGSFAQWNKNLPVGWTVEIGATNGADEPRSIIKKGPGPSLELSGDARTFAWHSVSQTIDVIPGQSLKLSYEGKAIGIKREGRQFVNCYVALFAKNHRRFASSAVGLAGRFKNIQSRIS